MEGKMFVHVDTPAPACLHIVAEGNQDRVRFQFDKKAKTIRFLHLGLFKVDERSTAQGFAPGAPGDSCSSAAEVCLTDPLRRDNPQVRKVKNHEAIVLFCSWVS